MLEKTLESPLDCKEIKPVNPMDCSQAPLFMEYFRQEYWSGLPFPSPGDLSNPGIKPRFPAFQANSLPSEPPGKPNISSPDNL